MKNSTTLKKCGLTVVVLLVCLAMMITSFAFVKPLGRPSADAAPVVFDGVAVSETCDYGDSFSVPVVTGANVKVTAPDGTGVALGTATDGKYSVAAKQVGNYNVVYDNDGAKYTFKVLVSLEKDYFLKVDFGGAEIPSYIQKDGTFTIPGAKVVYYDDNNILLPYPSDDVKLEISDSLGKKDYKVGDTFTATKNGKMFLTYSASIGGAAGGKKYFNKTFTINVQSTFSDTSAPTLSVAGVSTDVSVNRPVTLPTATASDSYDENIKIEITVTDPDNEKVRVTDVDKYGYARQDQTKLDADAVQSDDTKLNYPYVDFDNDKAMTFYPVKKGTYLVSYIATDDAGNSSSERVFRMEASDLAAPVFESVDDYLIPETWGINVKDASGATVANSGKITFPVPEVVDNMDGADDISVYFRITDADNAKEIVKFENIYAASDSDECKYTADDSSAYKVNAVFNRETPFTFDFSSYKKLDSDGKEASLPGTYTVLYRARDKANNTSSKSYTIELRDEYKDETAPNTVEVTVSPYVSAVDESMTIPSPSVADAEDSRPQVVYRVYSNNKKAAEENGLYITVKGGEKADFETRDGKRYLVIDSGKDDEKALLLGDTMYFYLSVTDKAGNVKRNTSDNSEDYTKCDAVVKVVTTATGEKAYDDYADTIDFKPKKTDDTVINAGDTVVAGGFSFGTIESMRKFVGFEVAVTDKDGNPLNVTLDTFAPIDGDRATVYVKNITFKVSIAGEHRMTVRVFDVNGFNTVYGYKFTAEKSTAGGTTAQATVIGTSGSVNVKYKLHNETMNNVGESDKTYFVARQISGRVFSLMGSEFTAKSQGSYSVKDGYIDADDVSDYESFDVVVPYGGNDGKYTFSVTDTSAPVIEVQGVMPTYAEKDAVVTLPSVIAFTDNGAAVVEVEVTNPASKKIDVTRNADDNTYTFTGATDGAYTVTYTATYADATPVTATYTVNVGDVIGPEFTVTGGTTGRMVVGDKFKFGNIVLADGEPATGVNITKKLVDPSREEVGDATVSGSYNTYHDAEDNKTEITLSMAGTYEVVYTATDSVGNETTQRVTITVVSSGSSTPTTITTLSTVLIIVAVVLLAGVIVYVVRFRKVKK